ncbi:MAG: hypothetical protein RR548_08870 [Carnobacterium sp.]|uniref:hypothetical protein n=2 Tax=Carnobacterium sp. TaxID=48221 RepID=UPI002FCC2A7C
MNKKVMVFFAAAFVLGGCSTKTTDEPVVESSNSAAQSSEEVMTESTAVESSAVTESSSEEDKDMAPVSEEEAASAEMVTDISQYEELAYTIDLSGYESRMLTDNQGTRVMLFSKDNEQVYKTVYVKNNNWLKVIDLKGDNLLLNEKIK